MNEINKTNKINNSNFNGIRPKVKEVKTMEQHIKKIVNDVLVRAEREVPPYGDFAPVYEEFKNTNSAYDATHFMLKIVKPPKNIEGHETLRNIELTAYKIPSPYKASVIIKSGSKDDIMEQLKNPEILKEVEDSFKNLSQDLSDF